jgi:penicillin-binding protein 1A
MKETGARAALPLWLDFMKNASAGRGAEDFAVPDGIVFKEIDPTTGMLHGAACRRSLREAFLAGTEPRKYCDEAGAAADEQSIQDEAPQ